MKFEINFDKIPAMTIGFTRSTDFIGRAIQLVRGILDDPSKPNHAFIVTSDDGYKFALEETLHGLQENSLEDYASDKDRIVCMYRWKGWTPATEKAVTDYLLCLRSNRLPASLYDFKGLFSFVLFFKRFVKPDPVRQWCSENVVALHVMAGCKTFPKNEITPDELLYLVQKSDEFDCILSYYK